MDVWFCARAGTLAERHTCELQILPVWFQRAPPVRVSGESFFLLTRKSASRTSDSAKLTRNGRQDDAERSGGYATPRSNPQFQLCAAGPPLAGCGKSPLDLTEGRNRGEQNVYPRVCNR